MSRPKLRAGIIGLGVGKAHARGYRGSEDAELVAVCDMNAQRLNESAEEWGVEARFTDYAEMFRKANLDIVSVCLPNALHAEATIAGLKAGVHVICEKPMAVTVDEAATMVETARLSQRHLMVSYNYRYRADAQWINRVVQSGRLGNIYHAHIAWHRETGIPGWGVFGSKKLSGGGALIDLGVHILDLALWMMNFPQVLTVSAQTRSLFGPEGRKTWGRRPGRIGEDEFNVDDGGTAFMRLAGGASLAMEVTWAEHTQPKEDSFRIELQGTEGTAILHVRHYSSEDTIRLYTEIEGEAVTVIPVIRPEGAQGHEALVKDLVARIRQGLEPSTTGQQGLLGVTLLDAIYRSSEQGAEVKLG